MRWIRSVGEGHACRPTAPRAHGRLTSGCSGRSATRTAAEPERWDTCQTCTRFGSAPPISSSWRCLYHAYQAELFPARIRARAVGFVYSFSRVSTVFTSFMIAFFLQNFGTSGVFAFIAFAMVVVMISIGVFGPRTNNLALEEISQAA